jgi:Mn2+/Fe2+ NRAMP family transporter
MFTKKKHLGSAHAFKTVIDWDAVWGAVIVVVIFLALLSSCGG